MMADHVHLFVKQDRIGEAPGFLIRGRSHIQSHPAVPQPHKTDLARALANSLQIKYQ